MENQLIVSDTKVGFANDTSSLKNILHLIVDTQNLVPEVGSDFKWAL